MKTKPKTLASSSAIVRGPLNLSAARIPASLLRGVSLRVRSSGSRFLFATGKDFSAVSRLTACLLIQVGGRAEITRSGNFGYVSTIERPLGAEIYVEG